MKLSEKYLNPGPLTDSGFNMPDRYQANLQESDPASDEHPVNGQSRLMEISGEQAPGIYRGMAYDSSSGRIESETYAGNPGSMTLYPDFNPAGFIHRHELKEFRRRTSSVGTIPVRAEFVLLCSKPNDKISRSEIADMRLHSTMKRHRSWIFILTNLIAQTPCREYSIDKTFVRWQKIMGLNRLNHLLILKGFLNEVEASFSKSSKLNVC